MRYAYQAYKTGNSDVGRIGRQPHPAKGVPDALRLSGLQDRQQRCRPDKALAASGEGCA
ncbi:MULTISPECIES: hypothetical protein [Citrobacter]|uniref:hypothetical protein n=1 Tax=Citrobacter TaxID=544 RepID=UPI0004B9E2DC|nr:MULTISPECIES: hypothetical protein [Citrobacter]MDE9705711.1 hypothetical protein [Citrobacter portucalensis]MDM2860093.1 hypothetical protein [Citrobacter sp. Cpo071]MDX6977147.1 hypothetical protein [Citrobacter portucalensis]MEB2768231.1 hypothetical protein [Citrobacter portucalensis]